MHLHSLKENPYKILKLHRFYIKVGKSRNSKFEQFIAAAFL